MEPLEPLASPSNEPLAPAAASRGRGWLVAGLAAAALLGFLWLAWSRCFFAGCPDLDRLSSFQPGGAPRLLDRYGRPFADLAPVQREMVPLETLPPYVAEAFLAVEDQRFREHHGIDWRRVAGATLANLRAGSIAQGFSTITMQVARNVFPEEIPARERTAERKLLEVRVAQEIERELGKDEILAIYLNHIYFGNGAHGIAAAARTYFGRAASRLTLPQAALLAALPKAPSHYDPSRDPEAALARRNLVLALMEKQGRITAEQAWKARNSPLGLAPAPREAPGRRPLAPYFVAEVRRELEQRFGDGVYGQPLRVWTTLDPAVQRAAEHSLEVQLRAIEDGEFGRFTGPRYAPEQEPPPGGTEYVQGAAVVLAAKTGDVLAWVGGRDFADSRFDRAAWARRQAGSAFKPFVYAAALAAGHPLSEWLTDRPLRVRQKGGETWEPRNFTGTYEGRVTLRDALVRSINVPTVLLAREVGLADVAAFAHRAGIGAEIPERPSMALGTAAVSPLDLAAAYTTFAGMGEGVEPRFVTRVERPDGRLLWRADVERRSVIEPGVAYLVTDVLREAVDRGTGTQAREAGYRGPAAGKTGTTNDGADAWFAGYTPDLVGVVWMGFDQPRPIVARAAGGRLAAPVWGRLMREVYQTRKVPAPWRPPPEVVERRVDPASGKVLFEGCEARGGGAKRELFVDGFEPDPVCPAGSPAAVARFAAWDRQRAAERAADRAADREAERERARLAAARSERESRTRAAAAARQEAERRREERLAQQRREDERLAALRRDEEEKKKSAERDRATRAAAERRQAETAEARLAAKRAEERDREVRAKREREKEAATKQAAAERRARREEEERGRRAEAEAAERREAAARRAALEEEEEDAEEEAAAEPADVTGWWEVTNRIESTNYAAYRGLRLGYHIFLQQEGSRIVGRGEKRREDGRSLPSAQRTPISITGRVRDGKLVLRFTEEGARRTTSGTFDWVLSGDGGSLSGTFASTAAATAGSSTGRRSG